MELAQASTISPSPSDQSEEALPVGEVTHEAILVVLSEPGEAVELKEFNGWYDQEHVPLRMSRFPEFLTGARYEAIDGQKPSFAAIYEISSLELFEQPRYQDLRTNRSVREAELFTRIGTIDRRTYRLKRSFPPSNEPTYCPHILTVEVAEPSSQLSSEMESFDGWRKTQLVEIVDSSIVGRLQSASNSSSRVAQNLFIFEFTTQDYEKSKQLAEMVENSKFNQTAIRKWKLCRGWKNSSTRN
ncbi:hypothetical protein H4Q26_008207 [Puccinia striiformis f. sp. tritici PST-130]|nr:hypothetical protein Pst134EB_010930 [Puccinia striiformis f. sp. tritici]KAI9612115.1 hypothetical protein H4Q26_008207 [Puccinia striiformis f. sp. tritici PST-130]